MKGVLLLNGQPYEGEIDADGALVYCCDGAYDWAKDKVTVDKNIGDFDSLPYLPEPPPEEIYPSEKDFTDGEIALFKMIGAGVTELVIYGGEGGREDHFLGNLQLLYYACAHGVKAVMETQRSLIFAVGGRIPLGAYAGKTLSVLPFGSSVHIIESAGLKYAYPKRLKCGECRGISNVVTDASAYLEVKKGDTALIVVNRGEV